MSSIQRDIGEVISAQLARLARYKSVKEDLKSSPPAGSWARSPPRRGRGTTTTRARGRRPCAARAGARRSRSRARRRAPPRTRTPRTPARCSLYPAFLGRL